MIGAVLNVGAVLLGLALMVIWIHSLVNWDGSCPCDKTQCESCPFPCEEHQKEGGTKTDE